MKNQGPNLVVITTCNNCEYSEYKISGNYCLKLDRFLDIDYSNFVRPHVNCPFLQTEKIMLEAKLEEIKNNEAKKLEKLIVSMFSGYEYSIDEYSGSIHLKVRSSIYSTAFVEFNGKFPEYEFSIDSYDSDTMQITIFKKVKNK